MNKLLKIRKNHFDFFGKSSERIYFSEKYLFSKFAPLNVARSFQLPPVKELGDEAFDFVFEGSDLLAKVTEGLDPATCKFNKTMFSQ